MSMRRAVAGCTVLVCLVALLVDRTEGHLTFFSPSEMLLMKEQDGKVTTQQLPQVQHDGTPVSTHMHHLYSLCQPNVHLKNICHSCFCFVQDKTMEIAVRLSPKQLEHVAPVLEEIIHEIVEKREKAK
ncbi:motilin-like isoform 1-T1 [Odontesthes bonariensis]|uniref:motilin-like isoform X1 n=1 Tax=Odontesthes bonariensis TaxID=219752 RepID=UPI003F58917B